MFHVLARLSPDDPIITIPFQGDMPTQALVYATGLPDAHPNMTFWRVDEISEWDNTRLRIVESWHAPDATVPVPPPTPSEVTRTAGGAFKQFLALGQ